MTNVDAREAALAIVPKFTGGLSFIGSATIAIHVFRDPIKRHQTFHRLVAVLSLCDMISSFSLFLSTWPIPADSGYNEGWDRPEHIWAKGNEATCTAQGFGIQFGLTTAFFNLMLSVHHLLVIRYNFTEWTMRRLCPWMITGTLLAGLAFSVPALVMQLYNNSNLWCWIAPNYDICDLEGLTKEQCRNRAVHYRWVFYFGPLWTTISIIAISYGCLYYTVRKMEVKASKWRWTDSDSRAVKMQKSQLVFRQATWYLLVFVTTWLPYTVIDLTGFYSTPNESKGFTLLLIVVICQPAQGFLNLLVYRWTSLQSAGRTLVTFASSRASTIHMNSSESGRSSLFGWFYPPEMAADDAISSGPPSTTFVKDLHVTAPKVTTGGGGDSEMGSSIVLPFGTVEDTIMGMPDGGDASSVTSQVAEEQVQTPTQTEVPSDPSESIAEEGDMPPDQQLNVAVDQVQSHKHANAPLPPAETPPESIAEEGESQPESMEKQRQVPLVRDEEEDDIHDHATRLPHNASDDELIQFQEEEDLDDDDRKQQQKQCRSGRPTNKKKSKSKKKKKKLQDPNSSSDESSSLASLAEDDVLMASLQAILIDMANESAEIGTA